MSIPDQALDGRLAIVGITGSGKSTTAKGGVERLLASGRRVCVVDLLDAWWGLRLARDGKTPAYPVAIFGGRHGDLPLTDHAGAVIGQAVAQSDGSSIVSLSELDGDAARRRFALAFFDALHKTNRAPLHLVIDETDFYSPQNPVSDGPGPLLLNRIKEIAARGRMRGFRCWSITQRPAKLHKDVLSQADTLIAMQLTSTQDRKAIEGWIGDQGDRDVGKAILASLPALKLGQGVVWSPRIGVLETTTFPLPATYDSSRTPAYGEKVADVELKPIDLGALRERMAKVEADTKANDPKALRAEIARLTAELAKGGENRRLNLAEVEACERKGYRDGEAAGQLRGYQTGFRDGIAAVVKAASAMPMPEAPAVRPVEAPPAKGTGVVHRQAPYIAAPPARRPAVPSAGLTGPEQRILDALAWWRATGVEQPMRVQVAAVARYTPSSGAFKNPMGSLKTKELIDYPSAGSAALTSAGTEVANGPGAAPTTAELHERIFAILDTPRRRCLEPLLQAYPGVMSREQLAAAAGYEPTSGAFKNPLGALRSLGFIGYPQPGQVVALPVLFVE